MTDKNTMNTRAYIITNLFWLFILSVIYQSMLFLPLKYHDEWSSRLVLRFLTVIITTLGVFLTVRKRRNYLSVAVNTLLPFQIYSLVSYSDYCSGLARATLIVSVVLSLAYFTLVVVMRGKRELDPALIKHGLLGVRTVVTLCFCIFLVPIFLKTGVGDGLYVAKSETAVEKNGIVDDNIMKNLETIRKLDVDVWCTLSVDERLDVLSVFKDIESRRLGINHEIILAADNIEVNTLGSYYYTDKRIVISLDHLKNSGSRSVLHTLFHEIFHAYTIKQVLLYESISDEFKDMAMFEDIRKYCDEYANYIDGTVDYSGYEEQLCEIASNEFAEERVSFYYGLLIDVEREEKSK